MFGTIGTWFADNWWVIILILLGAYLARRFGIMLIDMLVRRAITHRSHGDADESDVKKRQDTLIGLFDSLLRIFIWFVAGFTILGRLGLDMTPVLAWASVIGVALGFGAQSLIKDFLSGLFIILENQYRIGDVVTLDGADGKVEAIGLRSTVVRDNDGGVHYIPNGMITHTLNKTMGHARLNLTVTVSPSTDVDKLTEVINQVGQKMATDEKWKGKILEAPHFLNVSNFSNTAMEVKIAGKMQASAQWNVSGELRKRLLTAFNKEGVGLNAPIPTPPKKK